MEVLLGILSAICGLIILLESIIIVMLYRMCGHLLLENNLLKSEMSANNDDGVRILNIPKENRSK